MEFSDFLENDIQSNFKAISRSIRLEKDINRNESLTKKLKLRGNFILRQELKNLTPECSIKFSVFCNLVIFSLFISFGIPTITSSLNTNEFEIRYDDWYNI